MTKKQEILNNIRNVKNEHLKWNTYAEAKLQGIEINKKLVPVKHTDCACGKTFQHNEQIIFHLKSAQSIPAEHEKFHHLYEKLNEIINNKKTGNFFTKNATQRKHNQIVNNHINLLKTLSDNIIKSFDNVYEEVEKTIDDNINSWFFN